MNGGVNKEAHIAYRELGDAGDFLVAKTVLELEPDDFLLVVRQAVDQAQHGIAEFFLLERAARAGIAGGNAFGLAFFKALHSAFLAEDVESPVAADGEEPFDSVAFDGLRRLSHELNERILNDVACPIRIPEQAGSVARERPALLGENTFQKTEVVMRKDPRIRVDREHGAGYSC